MRDYCDEASGAKLDRPDLQRALKEAKAGVYELLLVVRVDRVARSVLGLADLVEELEKVGVRFASASECFDTSTPAGRMTCQLLGAFAEFERASIIERTIAALEKKASKGEWIQARAPLGYQRSEDGRELVVDATEAPIIDEIFIRYTDRLEGTPTIAKWLNERGYRTRSGKRFSGNAVGNILKNRAYLGELFYRGKHYSTPHKPLVSKAVFEQAQQILAERGEDPSLRRTNRITFSRG